MSRKVGSAGSQAAGAPAEAFTSLLYSLRTEGAPPIISPVKFARLFNLELQAIAQLAGVHRNTVRSYPQSTELQSYLRNALRVVQAAVDLRGNVADAIFWFRNAPIRELGRETADRLVSRGRTEAVLKYIDSLAAGSAG